LFILRSGKTRSSTPNHVHLILTSDNPAGLALASRSQFTAGFVDARARAWPDRCAPKLDAIALNRSQ
jgi:hypothetical protein